MLLNEPAESKYDVHFEILGFAVRISWTFWIAAAVLGYNWANFIDLIFLDVSSGPLAWLLVWTAALLVSILIHELGHAVAFRLCGVESQIVLYHFGGLAIPRGYSQRSGFGKISGNDQIFISAAGPGAQLILALVIYLIARSMGYAMLGGSGDAYYSIMPRFFDQLPGVEVGEPVTSPIWFSLLSSLLYVNLLWPLFNLLPVWPLDGGQIARELVYKFGGNLRTSSMISIVTAAAMAVWFLSIEAVIGALLFASFAVTNYQLMNAGGRWQ